MNYAALCTAVESYTENTFTADQLALFAQQTEKRVYNHVLFPALRKTATINTANGVLFVDAPTDFIAPYSVAVVATGVYSFLLNKDVEFLLEAYPDTTATGTPRFYAIDGPVAYSGPTQADMRFMVAPAPDAAYALELRYFYYPESIVTASTTWLGDNYDNVLLYGMLVEAYTFMKGDAEMMAKYDAMFKEALMQAKRLGDGMLRSDTYRSGQFRQGVV